MPAAVHHHATLDSLQRITFDYFVHETNRADGLVADKTQPGAPASIAAVGLALAAYPVGVEHGLITREEAIERTLAAQRFFWTAPHGPQPDATGHRGFYYHFLDRATGRRAGSIGIGPSKTVAPSATAGSPKPAFWNSAGRATTRRCCSTCWALAPPPIHSASTVFRRGGRRTSGGGFTTTSICIPVRSSRISFRTSGLGCVFWLTAAVAFLLWAMRRSDHDPVSFGIFVFGVIALVIWGAFEISEKR